MHFVMRTGEKTLEQAGSATTDDRGMYRIWGLQPGDYVVSAAPRNQNFGDIAQTIATEIQSLAAVQAEPVAPADAVAVAVADAVASTIPATCSAVADRTSWIVCRVCKRSQQPNSRKHQWRTLLSISRARR